MHFHQFCRGAMLTTMVAGVLSAATPNQITTAMGPVGVAATQSQLLFTQPFCTTDAAGTMPVQHGVYSVNTTTGAATIYAALPPAPATGAGFCVENYIAIAQAGNMGGFPAGTAYVTQGPTIFVVPPGGGSATPLTVTPPVTATQGHSGIQFDTSGAFQGRLIFTSSEGVWAITSAGVSTKLANGVAPGTAVF